MPRGSKSDPTESGVLVYPKLPVPEPRRQSEPRMPKGSRGKKLPLIAGGALVAGMVLGFLVRPSIKPDGRVAQLEEQAAESAKAADVQKQRADELATQTSAASAKEKELKTQLDLAKKAQTQLADKAKDAEKKAKEADAVQAKLKAAVDKSSGSVSREGDEIRLQLVDKVLFKVGDDQLTDRGKAVLAKVAAALKDMPDKQIWVQGHTDDTPIFVPPPPPAPKKPAKGPPPPKPAPPVIKFATNWELSAARALTVVHYLQDTAKLDPSRLAALAFGQYRPVSRSNKAANRRIEIVLYPHRAVIEKK
ncbi:MAG: OmpA family protein [Deltaproteobacteria bacterium]|nr:OmpA family protein [Deltaproteobacteria bacterium]